MTNFRGITLAAALLALASTLTLGGCGQAPTPEPTAQMQPIESTSPPLATPSIADATPAPSPSPTADRRPTSVPSPSPTSSPTTTSTSTPSPTTAPRTPTPAATTATPKPITQTTTPAPTPAATPSTDDPDANLKIVTLLPKDGIPAILDPTFIDAAKAWEQYLADEPVLGVSINGEHKAYSVPYLSSREIVNDDLGGVAIAATW